MQQFQYDLRCLAAKDNSITHAAVAPSNLDAAITMRFVASRGQHNSLYAHGHRTRQQSCSHYTAICNQRIKKRIELRRHEPPLAEHRGGTDSTLKRPQPHPLHSRLQPLYTEKHKVSCSGFLPKSNSVQHSCSHYTAICNQRAKSIVSHF